MIRALLFDRSDGRLIRGGKELHNVWQQDPGTLLWLDLAGEPEASEKAFLQEVFGLHELAVQDAQRLRHPPKLEAYDEVTFILLKELDAETEELKFSTIQLALFIGKRFLLTRHTGDSRGTDSLFGETADTPEMFRHGPAWLAMRLCRLVVNRYLRVLLALEPRLEAIEDEIMQQPDDSLLAEVLGYKTELKKFRRVFMYQQQVFHELKSGNYPGVMADDEHVIIDVYEQLERAGSLATLYHEIAADMADGYISVASHRLNQIMKLLTVVMSIFVPLSFLAGIYGMNFENMPELHSRSGYFILLGVMATIVVLLLSVFRRKHWL